MFQNLIKEMCTSHRTIFEVLQKVLQKVPEGFDHLLIIAKSDTAERLALTLQFLESGDLQISLHPRISVSPGGGGGGWQVLNLRNTSELVRRGWWVPFTV